MRGITSITFARAAEKVRRPGSFEVPFEPCSGRDEFRSQAKGRLTADQHGSGLERKQPARPPSFLASVSFVTPGHQRLFSGLLASFLHGPS